jgi:hypothetical protein
MMAGPESVSTTAVAARFAGRAGVLLTAVIALAACGSKMQSAPGAPAVRGPEALLGVWVPDAAPRKLLTADGEAPPLNAEAAELYAERQQQLAAGTANFDPTTWCAGPGMPRIMTMPYPFEIRRAGEYVAFIYGWYRWFRTVDMGMQEVDPPFPITLGFPVGHWEGDTLVIRTVGLAESTVMDASGLPRSDQSVLTERLRVLPDGRLEDRITVEDPGTFTQPWDTVLTFHRDARAHVTDDVCLDRLAAGEPAELLSYAPAERRAQPVPATSSAAAQPKPATVPSLTGMWEPEIFGILVPDTPLTKSGQEIVDRSAAALKDNMIPHSAWTSCRPGAISTMTMPREAIVILESPEEVTILFEMPRMVRRIRMNAEHPADLEPSYVGDSVGRWEGGTLVVDTIGYNGYGELDARGQPTSPRLHTVERFTPTADGKIDIVTTVTDPEYYDKPFDIPRTWMKTEARHPLEYDCAENPRKEDFDNGYYIRDRYRPVCMRVEGEGMEPSRMVCSSRKDPEL